MIMEELICRLYRLESEVAQISNKLSYVYPASNNDLNKKKDEDEKRFRTIQRTVSKLQEEIKDKNRSIKKLQSKISELEDISKKRDKDTFTWYWSK